jgi:hypothetical protein
MASGVYDPERDHSDMSQLTTVNRNNVVGALNEVNAAGKAATAAVALAIKCQHVAIGVAGPVAIPALPSGSKIIGIREHVTAAYPSGGKITVGDHSGGSGALAATSITDGTHAAVTAPGDFNVPVYVQPVGDLSISISGGDGSTGAATVMIEYIDA